MTDQILKHFNVDETRDAELINNYKLYDKGADCIVIHPGSHSIKFGLSSQSDPFLVPTAIAYPSKNGRKVIADYSDVVAKNKQKQEAFNQEYEQVIQPIEADLRKKKHLLIDQKSVKNIRSGNVSFKVFDQSNSVSQYNDKITHSYESRPVLEDLEVKEYH